VDKWRIFSYGDGSANRSSFNWHQCVFNKDSLESLLKKTGFVSIYQMNNSEVRGYDHGWINLGIKAKKPLD
jgi:hypothetical protein